MQLPKTIPKLIWFFINGAAFLCAQDKAIDIERSTISIHVGKAGLFSVAGHEHWVEAPISSGVLNESAPPLACPLAPCRATSSHVEKEAVGPWKVEGMLTLHGGTRPTSLSVKRSGNAYIGRTTLRQSDFGIKPITAAGGTVRVKNELEIDFHIVANL